MRLKNIWSNFVKGSGDVVVVNLPQIELPLLVFMLKLSTFTQKAFIVTFVTNIAQPEIH